MEHHAKACRKSRSILTEIVFPKDTNPHGTLFGGVLLNYIDKISAVAAMKHCGKSVVTASIDTIHFLSPVQLGEWVELEAFVTWTHRSAMEVYVRVHKENVKNKERQLTCTAFSTFVAWEKGKASFVPKVYPETKFEHNLFTTAPERHEHRLQCKSQCFVEADDRKSNP